MNTLLFYSRIGVGVALAATSTAAIVLALLGLAVNPVIWWFTLIAGVAFQLALYLLALGAGGDRWLSRVYLAVSVAATVAFFEYAWQNQNGHVKTLRNVATAETFATQQLQRQIKDAATQVATLQQTISNDTLNWRRLESLQALQQMEQRRATLLQRYATLQQQQNVNATSVPSGSVEAVLQSSPVWLRVSVFILLATLLDLGAIRLLRTRKPSLQDVAGRKRNVAKTLQNVADHVATDHATPVAPVATPATLHATPASDNHQRPETLRNVATEETPECNGTETPATFPATPCNVIDFQCNVAEDVATLAETIQSGKYGHQPVVRKIIDGENVRHPLVKQAFDLLIEQGMAEKRGNRFVLVAA